MSIEKELATHCLLRFLEVIPVQGMKAIEGEYYLGGRLQIYIVIGHDFTPAKWQSKASFATAKLALLQFFNKNNLSIQLARVQ